MKVDFFRIWKGRRNETGNKYSPIHNRQRKPRTATEKPYRAHQKGRNNMDNNTKEEILITLCRALAIIDTCTVSNPKADIWGNTPERLAEAITTLQANFQSGGHNDR